MIIPDDIYRMTSVQPLKSAGAVIGTVYLTYEVRQVTDVRNLSSTRSYRVTCTQRLVVPNSNDFVLTPQGVTQYVAYPALVASTFSLLAPGANPRLLSYSPRTVNSSVATSPSAVTSSTDSS